MSSFLGTGGAYGLITSTSSTSGCSSTLSKSSSVSSLAISTKRARTPRKRPNQSYIEAATLLSTACPNVFSMKNLHKKCSVSLSSLSSSSLSSSNIIPPFPAFNEADFLIEEPSSYPNPSFQFKFKPSAPIGPVEGSCIAVREASPPRSPPEFDLVSIFDVEPGEGIDSIMGKLSMNDCETNAYSDITSNINPFIGSPLGFGIGGKSRLGFGLGHHGNSIRRALRGAHSEEWWKQMPMVQMKDIVPMFNALPSLEKKKAKTKKKKLEELKDEYVVSKATTATSIANPCKLFGQVKSGLGLKLSYGDVIEAWGDRGYPFASGALESSAGIAAIGENDPLPETEGGGMREASVQRCIEKQRTRDFSNKIRYQVQKVNADCKPRMKGRFVRKTQFLQEAIREETNEVLIYK